MTDRAAELPLVELHTHLEGSLTLRRFLTLCERHGRPELPARCLDDDGAGYRFDDFTGFLDLYRMITSVIRTPADFHALVLDLGEQMEADEVGYAEVMVSVGVMLRREIDPGPVFAALAEAAAEVAETCGVTLRWIPDAVRQWGVDEGWRAWEAAHAAGRGLGVVGFGLGGDEAAGPAADFAAVFASVKEEGYGVTIHAGEITAMGPAGCESVRQAVVACGADRIGHGLAAAADPALLALLAERGVCVELCPRSNVATGQLPRLADHPVRAFLEAGVPCCLNTDDRTLFGLNLKDEMAAGGQVLGLSVVDHAAMMSAASQHKFS